MITILKLVLCLCFVGSTYAKSEMEIRKWFVGIGIDCQNDHPISTAEMKMLHEHKIPDTKNSRCLLACVYKKAGWMDDKGMFDVAGSIAMVEKEHLDDAKKLENSKKLIEVCKKVNDDAVTDGDKGCDRAAILTVCLTENAPKMGFVI